MTLYLGENLISGTQIVTDKSERIGQIIQSTIPLTDAGLHLLDGALISGSGSYSAFVDYIAGLVIDYPDLFDTEANWQTAVTTYGVCGKFVYDSVNNTVRLPKITGIVEGTTDLTALGDLVEAGLPVHTHNWTSFYDNGNPNGWSDRSTSTNRRYMHRSDNNGSRYTDILGVSTSNPIDANSIYGNSSTVQPQTIKVLYYIVIATTTKTDIEVDIDEIATDLNGKADIDLTNVNNLGTSRGASWAMPSDTYVDLTLGASGSTYTAPADGFIYIAKGSYANQYIAINIKTDSNANLLEDYNVKADSSDTNLTMYFPIRKNQKFTVGYITTGTTNYFRFIYAQGSESEA